MGSQDQGKLILCILIKCDLSSEMEKVSPAFDLELLNREVYLNKNMAKYLNNFNIYLVFQ
jgi:hypothetical protein